MGDLFAMDLLGFGTDQAYRTLQYGQVRTSTPCSPPSDSITARAKAFKTIQSLTIQFRDGNTALWAAANRDSAIDEVPRESETPSRYLNLATLAGIISTGSLGTKCYPVYWRIGTMWKSGNVYRKRDNLFPVELIQLRSATKTIHFSNFHCVSEFAIEISCQDCKAGEQHLIHICINLPNDEHIHRSDLWSRGLVTVLPSTSQQVDARSVPREPRKNTVGWYRSFCQQRLKTEVKEKEGGGRKET
ncbi:hypothetical protein JOB18_004900, partial [Solea senegalensis]